MSIEYYDNNSDAFFAGSVDADMSADRARFLAYVPKGGTILDAGCGSGRDTLAFKAAGYDVSAFDGSAAMAKLASAHTGVPVQHLRFDQVEWRETFDGIWACASLLHVGVMQIPGTLHRLGHALKPGGVLYASFKYGHGSRVVHGREFTDMTEDGLTFDIAQSGLQAIDMWTSTDVRPERAQERWISVIARR